jgi:hypothetical protein
VIVLPSLDTTTVTVALTLSSVLLVDSIV